MDLGRLLGLEDAVQDCEDHWVWVIGRFDGVRLDLTRTHTKRARLVDTRVFPLDTDAFDERVKQRLVARLRQVVDGPISCGRWIPLAGNSFELKATEVITTTPGAR